MAQRTYHSPAEIPGPRVVLTPLTGDDLDDVRRWRSDPEVTRFWITQAVPTRAEMEAWHEGKRRAGDLTWIVRDEARAPIGYIDLFNLDLDNQKAELALMIGERRVWGRGYAREALRTLLPHAFAPQPDGGLGLHKVTLAVFAGNVAARRVYEACGFREDGILREDMLRDGVWHDQILMSVLDREFAALAGRAG